MSSSPYISQELKEYLKKHNIQSLINTTVNNLARQLPSDPFAFIVKAVEKYASQDIVIHSFRGVEILSSEGVPVIAIQVDAEYCAKLVKFQLQNVLGIANDSHSLYIYDEDRLGGKGQLKGIQYLKKLSEGISKQNCTNQKQIDKLILSVHQKHQKKGLYQVNIASYLPSLATSHILNKPYHKVIRSIDNPDNKNEELKVNIMINCLQGSKLVASKCKAFKFILIGQNLKETHSVTTVVQAVKKTITSGKGGQAALKFHNDGTFICPNDTILDNLKILQQAIISTNNKDKFSIGISWMADNFYVPEQKKYELENPKALLDTDQIIDYYFKLVADKPLITYLQDPIFSEDNSGWMKLLHKFKDSKIRIGSRKLYHSIQSIKKLALPVSKQTNPQLQQNAINDMNSKRIHLAFHNYRPFQLQTLTKLLEVKKLLKTPKTTLILSDNMIQTHDTMIVDLCVGLNAYINLPPPIKFDRINKLNRINQILSFS